MLAVMSNVDTDFLRDDGLSGLLLYVIQAVALPMASALCLLPLAFRHRAGAYLAVTLGG